MKNGGTNHEGTKTTRSFWLGAGPIMLVSCRYFCLFGYYKIHTASLSAAVWLAAHHLPYNAVVDAAFRLETRDELKVITLFHLIGLALELFKVHMGSWTYPEEGYFKIFGVPLYSGFMYASVASYLCQAWRRLKVELIKWPPFLSLYLLRLRFIWIFHPPLLDGCSLVAIWTCHHRLLASMGHIRSWWNPLSYANRIFFVLIGFFIWIAENIATFFGAWEYPNQTDAWSLVHLGKVSSWLLLVIVSFLIVATLKQVKGKGSAVMDAGSILTKWSHCE